VLLRGRTSRHTTTPTPGTPGPDGAAPTVAFSDELEMWLRTDSPKTLGGLGTVFAERAFAVAAMLPMFVPALPLPTGGISHGFAIITILIAAQMISGRRTLWLPRRWQTRELGPLTTEKAIPFMTRWIRRFERFSRRRGAWLLERTLGQRIVGVLLIVTAVGAFVAPPFSGLDTLPGMGAVIICVGFILRDLAVVAAGTAVALSGIVLIVTIGAALAHSIRGLV
jgi:hypothetical protein